MGSQQVKVVKEVQEEMNGRSEVMGRSEPWSSRERRVGQSGEREVMNGVREVVDP